MGRIFGGTIGAGGFQRQSITSTTVFNPQGDWGALNILAHPRSANIELITFDAGKVLRSSNNTYRYTFSVRNIGTAAVEYDVDF